MMSRKPSRLLALVLLTALCCLLLAPCALAFARVDLTHPLTFAIQADDNEDDTHLPGVTFQLYQVADMDADARFALRSPYSTLNIDINALKNAADWAAASEAVKALTASETPDFTGTTDENGRVAFAGLNPGLYLVSGTPVIIGGWAYSFQSFLTSVPTRNVDDEWQYDVLSTIKLERSPALIDLECVTEGCFVAVHLCSVEQPVACVPGCTDCVVHFIPGFHFIDAETNLRNLDRIGKFHKYLLLGSGFLRDSSVRTEDAWCCRDQCNKKRPENPVQCVRSGDQQWFMLCCRCAFAYHWGARTAIGAQRIAF